MKFVLLAAFVAVLMVALVAGDGNIHEHPSDMDKRNADQIYPLEDWRKRSLETGPMEGWVKRSLEYPMDERISEGPMEGWGKRSSEGPMEGWGEGK